MASEIRVDKINSLSGVGTVTLSPTGVDIAGITTTATLRATTGIVTSLTAGSLTSLGAVSGTTGTFSGAVSGTTGTFSSHVSLGDSDELRLGAGNDLKLYHNGNNSFIEDAGTGDFYIRGADNVRIQSYSDNEDMAKFVKDGAVELYHNNSKKFETDSAGTTTSGRAYVTGTILQGTTTAGESNGDEATFANTGGNAGITIRSAVDAETKIYFSEGTSGGSQYRGAINYNHNTNYMSFSANETEKMRILSGGGITFNGDTATANALDDYEEGTWTPSNSTVGFVDGSTTEGHYTKIGDLVYASAICRIITNGSSIQLHIDGLPFTAKDGTSGSYIQGGFVTYANQGNNAFVLIGNNATRVYFFQISVSDWQLTNWDNAHLRFVVIYKTA